VLHLVLMVSVVLAVNGLVYGQSVDFKQAANESPGLGDVEWINGILNPNNSQYFEGMSVPQRVLLANIPGTSDGVHQLKFRHLATKTQGGDLHHAYDFLTSWAQADNAADGVAPSIAPAGQDLLATLFARQCGVQIGNTPDFETICNDLHSAFSMSVNAPKPAATPNAPADDVGAKFDAYAAVFGAPTVKIYSDKSILSASLTVDPAFTDGYSQSGSDVYLNYVLEWDIDSTDSSNFLLEYAGHLAVGININFPAMGYGVSKGAGGISGGNYHQILETVDDISLGSQDNQIQAGSILIPCPCEITGPDDLCPDQTEQYSGPAFPGAIYSWSISGDAVIVGPSDQQTVTIQTNATCGSFTLSLDIDCGAGGIPTSCDKTVNVVDTQDPVITCPAGETIDCLETPSFGTPTATDNCDPNPDITIVSTITTPGQCPQEFSVTRTWRATDACGNNSECSQTITYGNACIRDADLLGRLRQLPNRTGWRGPKSRW
jgi:hypothetical protein